MALFGIKKKETKKDAEVAAVKPAKPVKVSKEKAVKAPKAAKTSSPSLPFGTSSNIADAILRPRITEKSGLLSQMGVYTFEISGSADKNAVSKAVKALYKVTPVRVAIVNLPAKTVFLRGRKGTVAGVRKAMVTVKKGEKIDFV